MELVASSRIMTGGFDTAARAMEISCRCPWDSPLPSSYKNCVIAEGQHSYKAVGVGQLCGGNALLVCGVGIPVAQVLHDRSCKQVRVLKHHAQRAAQVIFFDLVDVDAVIADLAVRNIIKAVEQIGDGGLSRIGGPYKGDLLP